MLVCLRELLHVLVRQVLLRGASEVVAEEEIVLAESRWMVCRVEMLADQLDVLVRGPYKVDGVKALLLGKVAADEIKQKHPE